MTLERYFAMDDYGRVINPLLITGQVQGGVAQGIGQALLEHTVYDAESGQLLSGSLLDYALPRADDLPELDIVLAGEPTAANPLGVKGSGQAGAIAAPQTIICAILDALSTLGVEGISATCPPPPSACGGRSERLRDLLEPGEAAGAVGGEIAFFPPASDGSQQPPDARPRCDARAR